MNELEPLALNYLGQKELENIFVYFVNDNIYILCILD